MQIKISPARLEKAKAYFEVKKGAARQPDGRFLTLHEKRLIRKLTRRWKKQMNWVIDTMADLSIFKDDDTKRVRMLQTKSFTSELHAWLDGLVETENISSDVVVTARPTFRKGARRVYDALDVGSYGIGFGVVNRDAVEYLDKLKDLHLSNYRGSISHTTRQRIIKILSDAAASGQSYQETAKLIRAQGKAGVFSQARGELIATHETRKAYETGKVKLIDRLEQSAGVETAKLWQTVNDDRVTPECAANQAAGWQPRGATWPSGDREPPRGTNPRCRCHLAWKVLEPTQSAHDLNG